MENEASAANSTPLLEGNRTRAQAPLIGLDQRGRLRVKHLMALYGVSHSTIYQRIKVGLYPRPDGYDGRLPFWRTETIRKHIDA